MIIYKTTNIINNKIYIGQDSKNNPNYLGSGFKLLKAINKYGKENFKKEILQECNSKNELNECEKHWIKKLKSTNPNIGYNIVDGGQGGNLGEYANLKKSKTLKIYHKENPDIFKGNKNSNYNNDIFDFYNIKTNEFFTGTKFELALKIKSRSSDINSITNKKRLIHKNWILSINKDLVTQDFLKNKKTKNSHFFNNNKFTFIHESGLIEEMITQYELRTKYNLSHSAISVVCSGKRNIHKGWKILK